MLIRLLPVLSLFLLSIGGLRAQPDSTGFARLLSDYRIKASVGLQLWATYSQGMQVFDEEHNAFQAVDNRLNVQLRRSRFSLSGQPYENLKFKVTAALDLVGHDVLAATEAGGNNGPSPGFRLWNATLQWRLLPASEGVYFTAGYFVQPIGRESTTSALRSNSFEKAWSQNYLRRHLTGIGPGRAMGLMVGGQFSNAELNRHFVYEVAIQTPVHAALGGNSTGVSASPLLTGRITLQLGDPESPTYTTGRKINYFGKRRGVSLGVAYARQGTTELFLENTSAGMELLWNNDHFHLDGDFFWLDRSRGADADRLESQSTTGNLRLGKNIRLPRRVTVEPVVSYWWFRGAMTEAEIAAAKSLETFSGSDDGLDIGLNLYLNPNVKFSLFYARRSGGAGEGHPTAINNNFFRQSGVGSVRRGSYWGTGWVVIL